jgi:hypothetical protein
MFTDASAQAVKEEAHLELLDLADEGNMLLRSVAVTDCPSTWRSTPD